jgi:RalA-binding protein 1
MASLIAAAGSPEAALLSLWKEKQNAANTNSQLWRLVEKQRAMILGLNKDLERALKDKERYRKKLKEYTNQVPPVPHAAQKSDVQGRDDTPSPVPSEKQEDVPSSSQAPKAGEHRSSPLTQEPIEARMIPEVQLAPSPAPSSEAPSEALSTMTSPTDYSVKPLNAPNKGLGLPGIVTEGIPAADMLRAQPQGLSRMGMGGNEQTSMLTPQSAIEAPSLSFTSATPIIGSNGFDSPIERPVHPLRKAPPAPLNLSNSKKTSAHLHQSKPGEHSDSDYDDTLEVDEIPIITERGRRKTREEDDRVREAMMMKDEQARSKSSKKKSSSKSSSAVVSPNQSAVGSLSPRQFSPLTAGLPLSPRHPPANSLNAMLSPTNSDSSLVANRSISSPLMSPPLMSPGLPSSPRPGDRPIGSPTPRNPKQMLASPPMSPFTLSNGMQPPSARMPRHPMVLPPHTPQSYSPPQQETRADKPQSQSSDLLKPPGAQPGSDSETQCQNDKAGPEHVYRGLVSDQYPGLLLPPNALPSIDVKVFSSRLQPSRLSVLVPKPQEEDPVFILAIYARSDGKQLWRVEKTIMALPNLDQQLKSLCDFRGKLPDRTLFSGHAPAKMDARREALNLYFDTMLETPMNEKAALLVCEFFSNDVIGAQKDNSPRPEPSSSVTSSTPKNRQRKEGYLTKRGKNFGGWKARFFVLDGPEFRYYETAGGAHLGTIKLQNAQIGKQSQQQSNQSPQRRDESEDNQYRHAFLILEPKRKDSSSLVRHVLCAESDEERDAWVEALLQHVDWQEQSSPTEAQSGAARSTAPSKGQDGHRPKTRDSPDSDRRDKVQGISYDDTIAAEAPIRGPTHREAKEAHAHSPKNSSFSGESGHYPTISPPSNGAPIQNAESWGNKTLVAPTSIKEKKRSIFGFRGRGSSDLAPSQVFNQAQQPQTERIPERTPPNKNVFGIPLQEAVEFTRPVGVKAHLPAVVYRCLEYLSVKKASSEEGIFRLSGSNIVIKGLRDRFNNEGDVKLLDGQYYDVHAVASLLKLYLRELPASILTREYHLDFLKVLDLDEKEKKVQAYNVLVHKLPRVNFELIQAISSFLIEIVDNSDVNKMTVRNVGIVFAPTLNIPAPLISLFLSDYDFIFGDPIDEASSPIQEIIITAPEASDAIRSPRRQMFSDLPTPAYNETSFQHPPNSFPMSGNAAQPADYDTGFIPLHPSYEPPSYPQPMAGDGFGSLNGALQPGTSREIKQKRRESGMLLMNMGLGGQRKGSHPRLGDGSHPRQEGSQPRLGGDRNVDRRMVQEESAFD